MSSSQQPENAAPLLIRRRTDEEVQQTFQDNQKLHSSLTAAIATNSDLLADHPVDLPDILVTSNDNNDEADPAGSSETNALPMANAPNRQKNFINAKWGPSIFKEENPDAPPLTVNELTPAEMLTCIQCGNKGPVPRGMQFKETLICHDCGHQSVYISPGKWDQGVLENFDGRNDAGEGSANVEEEGERSGSTLRGSLPDGGGEGGGSLGL